MRLSNTGVPHKQESSLVTARIVTNEGLSEKFGSFQGFSLLRRVNLAVGQIGFVALKIAMLVALRNSRALHYPRRALLHTAIACHSHAACRSIGPRHQLPSCSPALRTILEGHLLARGKILSPRRLFSVSTGYEAVGCTARSGLWESCGRQESSKLDSERVSPVRNDNSMPGLPPASR